MLPKVELHRKLAQKYSVYRLMVFHTKRRFWGFWLRYRTPLVRSLGNSGIRPAVYVNLNLQGLSVGLGGVGGQLFPPEILIYLPLEWSSDLNQGWNHPATKRTAI